MPEFRICNLNSVRITRAQNQSLQYEKLLSSQMSGIRYYTSSSLTKRKRYTARIGESYRTFFDTLVYPRRLSTSYGAHTTGSRLRKIFNIYSRDDVSNKPLWERPNQIPNEDDIRTRFWRYVGQTFRKSSSCIATQSRTSSPEGKGRGEGQMTHWVGD